MPLYRITYAKGLGLTDEEVVADSFKDVHDQSTGGAMWIDFVRFVDDGHTDLLPTRVLRVRASHVLRVALVDEDVREVS